jgi:hypothetical protein
MNTATPRPKFLIGATVVLVGMAMLCVALYAGYERFGRPVLVIDFTHSIAHEQVHPMDEDRDSIDRPRLVDLRFPAGWSYTTDKAEHVTIQRNYILESELILYVQIEYPRLSLDEAVVELRQVRDHWHITGSQLELWYAEKQRIGPKWNSDLPPEPRFESGGGRWIDGTDLSGKRLSVGYWITEAPGLNPPYRPYVEFQWLPPEFAPATSSGEGPARR